MTTAEQPREMLLCTLNMKGQTCGLPLVAVGRRENFFMACMVCDSIAPEAVLT